MFFLILIGLGLALQHGIYAQPPGPEAPPPRTVTLTEAMELARINSPLIASANITALLAHEDRVQAKAALLPNANWFNQFIYTQPNGTPSGVFVANDGPHVYNSQGQVHEDLSWTRHAEYRRAVAAEVLAKAK